MSSGPENRFIASIHRLLPPVDEFYRMKNHNEYNSGIADCWYSARCDLWVEYKFVALPKRPETLITIIDGKDPALSKLQQEWITGRVREGRNVWVIIGCDKGGIVLRQGWGSGRWANAEFQNALRPRQFIAESIMSFCH